MVLKAAFDDTSDMNAGEELISIENPWGRTGMKRSRKTNDLTWWNGRPRYAPGSDFDHLFPDDGLEFTKFVGDAEVKVYGWPEKNTDAEKNNE